MPSDLGGSIQPLRPAPSPSSKTKTAEVIAPGQRWREIAEDIRAMRPLPAPPSRPTN